MTAAQSLLLCESGVELESYMAPLTRVLLCPIYLEPPQAALGPLGLVDDFSVIAICGLIIAAFYREIAGRPRARENAGNGR